VSILLSMLLDAQATEFEVGAGLELLGHAAEGDVGAGLGQAEIAALLTAGSIGLRAELELGQRTYDGVTREGGDLQVFPEWGAGLFGIGSWQLAVGFQPLPTGNEAEDAWRNALPVYSRGFSRTWPGVLLGARGVYDTGGTVSPGVWGGVTAGPLDEPIGEPLLGGGVRLGQTDQVHGHLALHTFPLDMKLASTAHIAAPLGQVVELGGDVYLGADRDTWDAAMTAQARFLPESTVQPVLRGEWARGKDPVAFDAGLLYVPHPSFHLRVAGRVEGQEWLAVASLSLVDEKPDQDGWSLD
jgi:hypothetical protein